MLLSAEKLSEYKVEATDGSVGKVDSFLFDDQNWNIRYVVADTGLLMTGRKVLIAPTAAGQPSGVEQVLPISLTQEQVKKSPDIDADKPVSRQHESELYTYYNWQPYWLSFPGPVTTPYSVSPTEKRRQHEQAVTVEEKGVDIHLRSTKKVIGYKINASDGHIGHVDDFIIDTTDWVVRYIVVDTRNWIRGKKVLLPPNWIKGISWERSEVAIEVTRATVKDSPEFNPDEPVNREYEVMLYDYYGRPKYWT